MRKTSGKRVVQTAIAANPAQHTAPESNAFCVCEARRGRLLAHRATHLSWWCALLPKIAAYPLFYPYVAQRLDLTSGSHVHHGREATSAGKAWPTKINQVPHQRAFATMLSVVAAVACRLGACANTVAPD